MTVFSPSDAAFAGFRLVRAHPKALMVWAGASFVLSLAFAIVTLSMFGGSVAQLEAAGQGGDADNMQAIMHMTPLYIISLPLGLLVISVFLNAVYRAVLRPQEGRSFYLALGREELRTAGAVLLYGLIFIGLIFVVLLAGGLLAVLAASISPSAGALIGGGLSLVALWVLFYAWVRFSLALPMTFAERRMSFRASWRLTRGRFWALLSLNILTVVFNAVVMLILVMVLMIAAVIVTGGDITAAVAAIRNETPTLASYIKPVSLLVLLANAVVGVLQTAILYAPAAEAYGALRDAAAKAA